MDRNAEIEAAVPEQFRREVLKLVRQGRSIPDLAEVLGITAQSLRNWKRQDERERDRGERDDGLASAEREELRKRVKRLEQERDILKRANGSLREGDRDPVSIYRHISAERARRIHAASKGRYGRPRVHAMLAPEGIHVGEKRVARLMALAGLKGAHQRRKRGCAVRVPGMEPFPDLVGRDFRPEAPEPGVGSRHQAGQDRRGVAVPRRGPGPVQPPDRRLEHGRAHPPRGRDRRTHDGRGSPQARQRDNSSFRPWRAAQAQPVDATRVVLLNGSYLRVLATTAWSVTMSRPSGV